MESNPEKSIDCVNTKQSMMESGKARPWLIAEQEVLSNLRNFKILTAVITLTALSLLSARIMGVDYQRRLNNWSANQNRLHDPVVGGSVRFELADGAFFHRAGIGRHPVILPPQPLSALVKGLDEEMDRAVSVSQRIAFGPVQNEPATSGPVEVPDASFVMKLLLSLYALLFSLDIGASRRESGKYRALLSFPIRRRALIFYKSLGATVSLLGCFTVAYLGGCLYLRGRYGALRGSDEIIRACLIYGMGALYGAVFVQIGFLISTIKIEAKARVMSALLAWAVFVLILPNAAVLTAKLLFPAPSYNQFNARLNDRRQQIFQEGTQAAPESGARGSRPPSAQTLERVIEMERRLTDEFLKSKQGQARWTQLIASFSPAGAFAFGLCDLAGTGVSSYKSYLDLLRAARDLWNEGLRRRAGLPPAPGEKLMEETRATIAKIKRQAEPLSVSLRSAAFSIMSLVFWGAGFGAATYRRFDRMEMS